MPEQPGWGPGEGVPEVPAAGAEIDITDDAIAAYAETAEDPATHAPGYDMTDLDDMTSLDTVAEFDDPARLADPAGEADSAGFERADGDTSPPDAADGQFQPERASAGLLDEAADDAPAPALRKILESILLVVDQPVAEVELAQVLETPKATVLAALADLAAEYLRDDRGFELRQVAGGWRLYTTPDCAPYVERFVLEGQQARLTQAALETLAVVAYRQPVSRQSVAAIRGVNVDGVIRTLLTRGLIAEAGQEGPGGAHLYVTTPYFLERLGLRAVDELPNLAPLLPANIDDLADGA